MSARDGDLRERRVRGEFGASRRRSCATDSNRARARWARQKASTRASSAALGSRTIPQNTIGTTSRSNRRNRDSNAWSSPRTNRSEQVTRHLIRHRFYNVLSAPAEEGSLHLWVPLSSRHIPAARAPYELTRVTEGTLEVTHDGKTERAGPGSVIYIAYGTVHQARNAGPGAVRYTVIAIGGDAK